MNRRSVSKVGCVLAAFGWLASANMSMADQAWAQAKGAEKQFQATATDVDGKEHDIKNVIFYWEEKVSETAFVPHELRHFPVKSGSATVNVKFESIKQVEIKPGAEKTLPAVTITLTNGKSRDFTLAIDGKIKGQDEFGEVELPATGLKRIVIK
jgi:mannose-6-phosphate isomerase-like protein (cupin superfamily)